MKKLFYIIFILLITVTGCSDKGKSLDKLDEISEENYPVMIQYLKNHEESSTFYIEDKDHIKNVVDSLKDVKTYEKDETATDDFTDIINLVFEDGKVISFEFEANNYVDVNKDRLKCKGLDSLRKVLEEVTNDEKTSQSYNSLKEYYERNGYKILKEIKVSESDSIQSEKDIFNMMKERGFEDFSATYSYNMNGEYVMETEIDENSDEKHPMYDVWVVTDNDRVFILNIINGQITAYEVLTDEGGYPVGYSKLLIEEDKFYSYDYLNNVFYNLKIKDEFELIERIDYEHLKNFNKGSE